MKQLRTIILVGITLFMIGCSSSAVTIHDSYTLPEVKYDKGLVYFYRPKKMTGAAISYDVHWNAQTIGAIKNGTFFHTYVDPGMQTFWAKTEAKKQVILNIETGKTYYVRCRIGFGVLVGRPKFEVVNEAVGRVEVLDCKYTLLK